MPDYDLILPSDVYDLKLRREANDRVRFALHDRGTQREVDVFRLPAEGRRPLADLLAPFIPPEGVILDIGPGDLLCLLNALDAGASATRDLDSDQRAQLAAHAAYIRGYSRARWRP